MKTIQNILPTVLKSIILFSIILISSCSKSDDSPAPITNTTFATLPNSLVTTFTGILDYEGANGTDITDVGGGTAVVSGTSSNYTITFNNNVPSISNITFTLINGHYIHAVGGTTSNPDESVVVRVDPQLALAIDRNGSSWSFNGQ